MVGGVLKITATAVLAAALWVVPSVGTRGQGTLGDRFTHPDRGIFGEDARSRELLARTDAIVAAAAAAPR